MKRVAVIGAGAMGSGIGQVAAMAGHEVILFDAFPNAVTKARDAILLSLNKLAEKGKITDQEAKAVFGRMYFVDQLQSTHRTFIKRDCCISIQYIVTVHHRTGEWIEKS